MKTNNNIPAYRFQGYTDAWELRKLGEVMEVTSVKRIHQSDWTDFGVRFLRARDIVAESKNESVSEPLFISQKKYDEYTAISGKVIKGDLLVTGVGTIGIPMLIEKNEPIYFKDGNIIWFKNENHIDGQFFYYSFIGKKIQSFIKESAGIGTVGTFTINTGKNTPIDLPVLKKEQEAIGTFFSTLDQQITLHQRKLDTLKEQKKTYLKLLFPAKGQTKPALRFQGFEDDWEEVKVADIFQVTRGQVLSTNLVSDTKSDEYPYPVYSSQTKNNGLMGFYKDYLFDTAITWTTDGANAGTVRFREGKFYSTNVNGVLLSAEGYNNLAISEILNTVAWKYVSKVGNPKLMNNIMSEIILLIPGGFAEQEVLSSFFQTLDQELAQVEDKLASLKEMKKTLLRKLFV
ncbi:restriction endonuclease subunit S [Streptococcus suis]